MRRLFLFLIVLSFCACTDSKRLALSGRLITIEQWQAPEGLAWAFTDHRLTVYRMYDYVGRRDEVVFTRVIAESDWQRIRAAISAIPDESMGKHFDAKLSTGAPLLRITRTGDGSMSRKRMVEFAGFVPEWSMGLISVVSSVASPEAPITYIDVVHRYRLHWDPKQESTKIYSRPLDDYYGTGRDWWKFWR